MMLNVAQSERGWEVTYDGIFGPEEESPFFQTEGEARIECARVAAQSAVWNARGLADAPHLDAF